MNAELREVGVVFTNSAFSIHNSSFPRRLRGPSPLRVFVVTSSSLCLGASVVTSRRRLARSTGPPDFQHDLAHLGRSGGHGQARHVGIGGEENRETPRTQCQGVARAVVEGNIFDGIV